MSYNGTVEGWLGVVEMTLTAGTKLEPHEVVAPLGASGKGDAQTTSFSELLLIFPNGIHLQGCRGPRNANPA